MSGCLDSGSPSGSQDAKNCREVQVPYDDCKNVQVPYDDCKNVQVPYQATEYYNYNLEAQAVSNTLESPWSLELGTYALGKVKLKNIDDQAGWFTVTFYWRTLKNSRTDNVRHYIEPDETILFESTWDIKTGEDTEYEYTYISDPVQKSRVVTKYKTEQKCETKYKTEQKCD